MVVLMPFLLYTRCRTRERGKRYRINMRNAHGVSRGLYVNTGRYPQWPLYAAEASFNVVINDTHYESNNY
jgi:hypothetical protein